MLQIGVTVQVVDVLPNGLPIYKTSDVFIPSSLIVTTLTYLLCDCLPLSKKRPATVGTFSLYIRSYRIGHDKSSPIPKCQRSCPMLARIPPTSE